ncbi:MAG: ABC transporter ATP-binding protein [Lentisphaerae bacterium RIFOXYA12_FULL_48_11]|nr:MAG: ABC transporter ATP-binding protein [Lentisphaerae bacterium RIFOXYA12_FULL_48_11]
MIEGFGLKRYYQRGSETVKAVDGIDIVIRSGEMVSVLGPSGSGKTTLVHLLSCLDAPTGGSLLVEGVSVEGLSEDELAGVRRKTMGFVFQKFYLLPTLTVAENVELPLLFLRKQPDRAATMEVLGQVGLEDRAEHLPNELSGGQMQRAAIARGLIINPRLLIADEPTGNLDSENSKSIFDLFGHLVRDKGISILVTTHNLSLGRLANRVITLQDGKVVKEDRF